MTRGLRDFALALSFIALMFARLWGTVLNTGNFYFYRDPPHWLSFALPTLAMIVAAVLLAALAPVVRRASSPLVRPAVTVVLLCGIAIGLNALRQQTPLGLSYLAKSIGWRSTWVVLGVIGMASLWATLRFHRFSLRAAVAILLCLTPFAMQILLQASYRAASVWLGANRGFESKPPAVPVPTRIPRRALLLLFDGLDQKATFSARSSGLALPAFDALRARSVHAENAYPVSNNTAVSVPSLITGRAVTAVKRGGPAELMLDLEGGRKESWSKAANLFTAIRDLGGNSALVGWYHPYCRVLGGQLASCAWSAYTEDPFGSPARVRQTLLRLVVETAPKFLRPPLADDAAAGVAWHAAQLRSVHTHALAVVADSRFSLVFIHYPVPHPPYVAIDRPARIPASYDSNLVLADQALAEITRALATSSAADSTAVFVTSDHYWPRGDGSDRAETQPEIGRPDHRIPLLVRFPGQESPVPVRETVSHLLVHDLVREFLRGRVTTHAQAAAWMSEHKLRVVAESRPGSLE